MTNQIDKMIQRSYQYFYRDGLVELAVGGLFLMVSLFIQTWTVFPQDSPMRMITAIGLPVLTVGGALLVKRIVGEAKERVTYPRTGYVTYRQGEPSLGRWPILVAALVLIVLSYILPDRYVQISLMEGGILGVVLFYMGYRVGLSRFYLLGLVAILIGTLAAFLFPGDIPGTVVTFGATGAVMLLSGAYVLLRYLSQHPRPDQEAE